MLPPPHEAPGEQATNHSGKHYHGQSTPHHYCKPRHNRLLFGHSLTPDHSPATCSRWLPHRL